MKSVLRNTLQLCILSRKWKSGLRTLRIRLPAGDGKLLRSSQTLELLHVDLIGPRRVMSISHQRYVLVAQDYYSGYIAVRLLEAKQEASAELRRICQQFARQICQDYPMQLWA
ncbi:hypothetical protein MIR68_004606 [Amoeboaphelidium protococcarum]|nr:hypothetical protein MIR68_004606 [Amoeboaphelidium protococcarum]